MNGVNNLKVEGSAKKSCIDGIMRKERIGIIWLKTGIWKLKEIRRGFERGRCPLCLGKKDAKHKLLKCKMKKWGVTCMQ
jgi:hypothetical protein